MVQHLEAYIYIEIMIKDHNVQRQIYYIKYDFSSPFLSSLKIEGVRNISNQLSITTKIDREHPDMRSYAKQKGWWDGKKEFDFAATYSYLDTAKMMTSPGRYCEGYKLLNKHKGNFK